MYLDKIYSLQTGVSLEISTTTLRDLIKDAMSGQRIPELANIRCPADIFNYLSVIVHKDVEGLIKRRQAWIGSVKKDLLAGRPVAYSKFDNLFWRHLDEEDLDGDEWYRLTASENFHAQLSGLLNMLRSIEYKIHQQKIDMLNDSNLWSSRGVDTIATDIPAFQL